MDIVKEIERIKDLDLIKKFKTQKIEIEERWMPLCRWKYPLPKKIYLKKYEKSFVTRGNKIKKISMRLIDEQDRILFNGWNFSFLPTKFKINKNRLYCKIPDNLFCIKFYKKNRHIDILTLPKKINLDFGDYIAFGLLQGEMLSSFRGKSRHYFCFANCEYDLVRRVLKLLSKFNITSNMFSYQVYVNHKNNKKLRDIDYINYWFKKLNVPKDNFVKIFYRELNTKSKYGSISIKYYNTMFRLIFQLLFESIKRNIEINQVLAVPYLKGLIAAEGGINLSNSLSLNYVSIGGSKENDTKHYKDILNCLKIKMGGISKSVSNEDAIKKGWKKGVGGFVTIQGLKNFEIIYNNQLIITPFKYLNFLIGMSNHRDVKKDRFYDLIVKDLEEYKKKYHSIYTKIIERTNKITNREKEVFEIIKKDRTTIEGVANKLKIRRSSANRILLSMKRKGIVKSELLIGKKQIFSIS